MLLFQLFADFLRAIYHKRYVIVIIHAALFFNIVKTVLFSGHVQIDLSITMLQVKTCNVPLTADTVASSGVLFIQALYQLRSHCLLALGKVCVP